jgi:hypothetical protein
MTLEVQEHGADICLAPGEGPMVEGQTKRGGQEVYNNLLLWKQSLSLKS